MIVAAAEGRQGGTIKAGRYETEGGLAGLGVIPSWPVEFALQAGVGVIGGLL
jgi:hypothetical protein